MRCTARGVAMTSATTTAIATVSSTLRCRKRAGSSNAVAMTRLTDDGSPTRAERCPRYVRNCCSNGSFTDMQGLPEVAQGAGEMLTGRTGTAPHEVGALIECVAVREMQHDDCTLLPAQPGEGGVPVHPRGIGRCRHSVVNGLLTEEPRPSPAALTDALSDTDTGQPRLASLGIPELVPRPPGGDHDLLDD